MEDEVARLQEALAEAETALKEEKARKPSTTLSGVEFLFLFMASPLLLAFVLLGIIIVWKTTSNPAEVAPHLEPILLAFAIFGNPVSGLLGALVTKMALADNKKE